ncbi:LacI family DNA-binding transcriptional regulator [Sphingomonas sp.]|uniref:LacI family DNA-binding transcriptional regulator n=1 Tax=Sphingomonas sp. TaxID=28214 RepID=UPI001B0B1711|nr:LacI family DNA-binding transcriptional regulator [Sphingomonas sp.]MBO9711708.1 LacI family DNA-binding transcriptional regulator [Sphingomonas sp.]
MEQPGSSSAEIPLKRSDRATMRDVALVAGVSMMTVSRVLNRGMVSPETRARVEAVIRRLDYRPNDKAQSMARAPRLRPAPAHDDHEQTDE